MRSWEKTTVVLRESDYTFTKLRNYDATADVTDVGLL